MEEKNDQLQATLTALLTKFDAMDLRIENLGKQIESTQESVDEIRHRQAEIGAAPGGCTVTVGAMETGTSSATWQVPRLANARPPLLNTPQEIPAGAAYVQPETRILTIELGKIMLWRLDLMLPITLRCILTAAHRLRLPFWNKIAAMFLHLPLFLKPYSRRHRPDQGSVVGRSC